MTPTTTKDPSGVPDETEHDNASHAILDNNTNGTDNVDAGPWYKFRGNTKAQGYALAGVARGALVMSNIFLSTAFLYLASEQAGCVDEVSRDVIDDCDGKAYGFKPASFVSTIAVVAGLLSALFMPVIGAMVDYTSHRRTVGIVSAILMVLIQIVQIYTTSDTWLVMALLQAIAGFLYQVQVLAVYAYLPDIAKVVGESIMTNFSCK